MSDQVSDSSSVENEQQQVDDQSTDSGEAPEESSDEEKPRWYVIHTFAGQEEKIRDKILETSDKEGLSDDVENVVVPTNEVTEIKQGDKKEVEKQLYPGYVFVKMKMTDRNWHLIRNIDGVTGFVGTQMNPIPLKDTEMSDVMSQISQGKSQLEVEFSVGDTVRIISGAMEEMTGTVKDVDIEKTKLHVSVDMFGRSTPVELDFDQAEKL
ncbi:MAG: transcription termination/antitermination protein NusG [bacterium]